MSRYRVEATKDLISMINKMVDTNYFYIEESGKHEFLPDPTCPTVIKELMEDFLIKMPFSQIQAGTGVHYHMTFGIHFIMIHLPEDEGFVAMGPLRYKKPSKEEITGYVEKYKLEKNYHYVLNSYLNSITDEHASAEPLKYIVEHIYEVDIDNQNTALERVYLEALPKENISIEQPVLTNMRGMDQKYEREQELRVLVSQGKRREAGVLLETQDKTRYFRHSSLNALLRLLSYNITYKQALIQTKVPATHIEQIYASYIRDIASNMDDIEKNEKTYSAKMLDEYCKLARDYATQNVSRPVKKAMNYIILNYKEKITVNSIADYLEISPNYLSSIFKKETGDSLTSYINQVRINISISLLANTNIPISEVAEKVGIGDYNYFSRIFKKQLQISPTQYRKDYQCLAEKMYQQKYNNKM